MSVVGGVGAARRASGDAGARRGDGRLRRRLFDFRRVACNAIYGVDALSFASEAASETGFRDSRPFGDSFVDRRNVHRILSWADVRLGRLVAFRNDLVVGGDRNRRVRGVRTARATFFDDFIFNDGMVRRAGRAATLRVDSDDFLAFAPLGRDRVHRRMRILRDETGALGAFDLASFRFGREHFALFFALLGDINGKNGKSGSFLKKIASRFETPPCV